MEVNTHVHSHIKIVINPVYGGFFLNETILNKMVEEGYPLPLNPNYAGKSWDSKYLYSEVEKIPRHDTLLVKIVEELGESTDLLVVEIPLTYTINTYDGLERVSQY
jgi:hypothetical protein